MDANPDPFEQKTLIAKFTGRASVFSARDVVVGESVLRVMHKQWYWSHEKINHLHLHVYFCFELLKVIGTNQL